MDMDFFNDQILTDLDRADYVGGIDNEAIFFEDLQVANGIGRIGGGSTGDGRQNTSSAANTAHIGVGVADTPALICSAKTETPVTSPTPLATIGPDIILPPIPTVSARVSLTATPHIGIHASTGNSSRNSTHTHLPESPPDSGSEPPYSPLQDVQGLTLTTRDIFHPSGAATAAGCNGAATPALNGLHLAPVHQHHHMQSQPQALDESHPHHYVHMLENQMNLNALTSPTQATNVSAIRVKHEAGLIINPNSLAQTLNSQNLHHHHPADTHIEMPGQQAQLMYSNSTTNTSSPNISNSNQLGYDSLTNVLANPPPPPPPSYQLSIGQLDPNQVDAATCMLTAIGDLPHVQVVGTVTTGSLPSTPQLGRTSAPSTPNHQSSSRKRKMATQIDCADFACVKPDPGLMLSPSRSSICGTPLPGEISKRCATSPLNIQLSANDIADTPAHSMASLSPALSSVNMDGSSKSGDGSTNGGGDPLSPCIRFTPFQPQNWHELCDQSLQEISVVYYRVDADKGFNFSVSDDAFVCQKKNHFQITCHARLQSEAKFVKTPSGLEKIKSFHLHFYGVKLEAPNQTIRIEQSQSDRSKKPFYPVPIDLQSHIVSKVTVGRLHFSETTNNNMRKKGRPNPEQRYFQLVVGLHVHTASGDFPIISQGSDKIIVRASNPGQFESDVDLCWQRGITQDSIFHAGRVGINTDRPDESLVIHGNLKISGHIVQPSDSRAKQEISELDTSVQLRNLQKIRIVRYRLEPQFALHSGLRRHSDSEDIVDTGVIAQEVREVIPDAVQEAGSVVLPNGEVIENFLLVNKDRILMENIGAVKELCKVTGTLETRIENLERVNHRLQRAKENELQFMHCKNISGSGTRSSRDGYEICSNRTLQIIIFLLVIVMAACLAAVSTLYFVEHNKKQHNYKHLESIQLLGNGHTYGHDGMSLTEQEHNFIQLHNMLKYNRTHTLWPTFTNQSSSQGGLARSQSQNGTQPYRVGGGGGAGGGGEPAEDGGTGELIYEDVLLPPSSQQSSRNDEITVVMEKPSVSHELVQPSYREPQRTTTAPPIRTNKTVISKHKNKWPQPQMVLRVMQAATHRNALPSTRSVASGPANEESHGTSHNASETSTEKISEVILVQQDFENNSIDTDSQQTVNRHKSASSAKKRPSAPSEGAHSEIQKLHVDNTVASTASSINDGSLISPTQSNVLRSNAKGGDLIIYKTVPPPTTTTTTTVQAHTPPNKVNTDAPHTNYSLETQPISNKSRNYVDRNPDNSDNDLQSLTSNNNESIFNPGDPVDYDLGLENRQSLLGRRSASVGAGSQQSLTNSNVWVQSSMAFVEIFGEPEQCNSKIKREDVSNCQSVCFEENNQLLAPIQSTLNLKQTETKKVKSIQQEEFDNENHSESEDNDAIIHEPDDDLQAAFDVNQQKPKESQNTSNLAVQGKAAHATQALAKELNADDQQQQQSESEADNLDAILEHSFSDENLDVESKLKKQDKADGTLSVEPNRPPSDADCWKIRSCILAERLNNTFAFDDFCPKLGKSFNLTYIIPLSRFFKEQSIELHLTSSLPLQWVICNLHEHSKSNGKHLINSSQPAPSAHHTSHQSQNVLQRRRNTSLLLLNIPSRGYFVKDLVLRATNDPEKSNVCQEKPHDTTAILQYNFRILRDCD